MNLENSVELSPLFLQGDMYFPTQHHVSSIFGDQSNGLFNIIENNRLQRTRQQSAFPIEAEKIAKTISTITHSWVQFSPTPSKIGSSITKINTLQKTMDTPLGLLVATVSLIFGIYSVASNWNNHSSKQNEHSAVNLVLILLAIAGVLVQKGQDSVSKKLQTKKTDLEQEKITASEASGQTMFLILLGHICENFCHDGDKKKLEENLKQLYQLLRHNFPKKVSMSPEVLILLGQLKEKMENKINHKLKSKNDNDIFEKNEPEENNEVQDKNVLKDKELINLIMHEIMPRLQMETGKSIPLSFISFQDELE